MALVRELPCIKCTSLDPTRRQVALRTCYAAMMLLVDKEKDIRVVAVMVRSFVEQRIR